ILQTPDKVADNRVVVCQRDKDLIRIVRQVAAEPPLTESLAIGLALEAARAARLDKDGLDPLPCAARLRNLFQLGNGHPGRYARHLCRPRIAGRQSVTLCGATWYAIYQNVSATDPNGPNS